MKPIATMTVASVASWLGAAAICDRRTGVEILFGMLGPLAVATGTWVLVERTYRSRPEELTGLMALGFVVKMVFLAIYIAVMLRVMRLRPIPFVASFTGYFIGLYLIEALYLRRLFSQRTR
jgi:hypothetical protein